MSGTDVATVPGVAVLYDMHTPMLPEGEVAAGSTTRHPLPPTREGPGEGTVEFLTESTTLTRSEETDLFQSTSSATVGLRESSGLFRLHFIFFRLVTMMTSVPRIARHSSKHQS